MGVPKAVHFTSTGYGVDCHTSYTRSHSLQTKAVVLASVYRPPPPFRFGEYSWHAINGTQMGTPLPGTSFSRRKQFIFEYNK